MSYNYLSYKGRISPSQLCLFDSNIGYEADFSKNGEVDGWEYFSGIHTYGCWNNFLFGTLYTDSAVIGRLNPFRPIVAEDFFSVKIVMKLNIVPRVGSQAIPTKGRIMWRTLSDPVWSNSKQQDFDINNDTEWNSYYINMSDAQWWQGDIYDLRIYPILSNGRDGDEFYIRSIEITSVDQYRCMNVSCDYHNRYVHNCPGIGERGYCKSKALSAYTFQGVSYDFADEKVYTIEKDISDRLLININGYGYESIILDPIKDCRGDKLAKLLTKEISKSDVGGYAECEVVYTDKGEFIIYSGTYANDSTVEIDDTVLARCLNFIDTNGIDTSVKYIGKYPSSGFLPLSSFKIKTHQIYSMLDSNNRTEFYFNPFIYNVEGGRRDWLSSGLGNPSKAIQEGEGDESGLIARYYDQIENANKTIIDFTHPVNASGRITKVYAGITLDQFNSGGWEARGALDSKRKSSQLNNARIMFFRPIKGGNLRVLPIELPIKDRVIDQGKLYSAIQEYVEIDCDIFLNKGDLIGVYNANIYRSRSISGKEVDALYYQVDGKATGTIEIAQPSGNGSAGLLLYARSNQLQNRLTLNIDFDNRINVKNIYVIGNSEEPELLYNVARCLDIDWEVDLFGEDHTTGYVVRYKPLLEAYFNHPNIYYGKECLNDGITTVPDGLAADSFSVNYGVSYSSWAAAVHKKNGGKGVILQNPRYFSVNGDSEWLAVYVHANMPSPFAVQDFEEDPIAFTLMFPFQKEKTMRSAKIYFKEKYNFRSFAISTLKGVYYTEGNADDCRFELIPNRTDGFETPWEKIVLDGLDYVPEDEFRWADINLYLAKNPCIGHPLLVTTGVLEAAFDGPLGDGALAAYFDKYAGLQYYATGKIINNKQYIQATKTDWSTIEFKFPPREGGGFRFYCSNHQSTKICEFEVYCVVKNVKSSIGGSADIMYSMYGDYWWPAKNEEIPTGIRSRINDTPRFVDITIKPIAEISLSDIEIDISYEDVPMGEKGCQYIALPEDTKRGMVSKSISIDFKNVYNKPYDLYVDIGGNSLLDSGVAFYSLMNDRDSISNPVVGVDAYYRKHKDYPLLNYQKNVAINCPVYKLNNLIEGAHAWFSHDRGDSWESLGIISSGKDINFKNLPNAAITTINLPILKRSQWWKIGFYDSRIVCNIREIKIYYNNSEIKDIEFFHQKNSNPITTGNINTAPHLSNNIIDGSYYVLTGNSEIGFKLPNVQEFNRIVIYHDFLLEYENSSDKAGIDSSTAFCLHGTGDTYQTDTLKDVSYYEHDITVVGSGIYCDEEYEEIYYNFTQDFSVDCNPYVDSFPTQPPDPEMWTDLVNASAIDGKLYITNFGTIGQAVTVPYYSSNFDVKVDIDIVNGYNSQGWGCFLEVYTDDSKLVRIGRMYYSTIGQVVMMQSFGTAGWKNIGYRANSNLLNNRIRIRRISTTTTCYMWESPSSWVEIGKSEEIGELPIKVRLLSDLTPLAFGRITTAKFYSFEIDKNDADWGINTNYDSTFTCVSGVGPNGFAYAYNIGTFNTNDASGYKLPKINYHQNYPLDEKFSFTFDFSFKATSFVDYTGNSNSTVGVSVGILGLHVRPSYYAVWEPLFTGAQIVIKMNSIGIGIHNDWCELNETYSSLNTTLTTYFCRFTSNGNGHYHCYVWTDSFGGNVKVADFGLDSALIWRAYKIGVGSGCGINGNYGGRAIGWVSDFNFSSYKRSYNHIINRSSIRFSGFENERLLTSYSNNPKCNISKSGLNFNSKRFTIDFFIKFNDLPDINGDKIYLLKRWDDNHPLIDGEAVTSPCSWAFIIERIADSFKWRLYLNINSRCRLVMDYSFHPDLQRWYHFYLGRGTDTYDTSNMVFLRDGHRIWNGGNTTIGGTVIDTDLDLVIGENLDGWMEEIRVSSDYSHGGSRCPDLSEYYEFISKPVPSKQYERYYTMVVYDSSDNINYGRQMLIDVMFDNNYSYHEPFSIWSETYYTYLALDLGQRHDIDIIRSFPVDTSFGFSLTENILYSNKDTADPIEAFLLTDDEKVLNDSFTAQDYDYPKNWTKMDSIGAVSYVINDSFYQACKSIGGQVYSRAKADFYFDGDFDFGIDYNLYNNPPGSNVWEIRVQIEDPSNDNNKIRLERCFKDGGHKYIGWVKDNSSTWTKIVDMWCTEEKGSLRIERYGYMFRLYVKNNTWSDTEFLHICNYQIKNDFSKMTQLNIYTYNDTPSYPNIEVLWDNFEVYKALPIYSTFQDSRWVKVKMLNGDGVSRIINNAGIYSNISSQSNAVGQYNNYWTALGTACTSYADAENIALGATVSGSSYTGTMTFGNAVNGIIPEGDLNGCWGSGEEKNPYITVYFKNIERVFRFKIYHGYDSSDQTNLITDYKIQISTNGTTFSTIFTITGNDLFVRTHDLAYPVEAIAVRLYIDRYNAIDRFVWISNEKGQNFWKGAVIREFEIYKYYGFTVISSEDMPIIAVDLMQPFFIEGHSLVGIDSENEEINWDNDNSNFAWSNSNLFDPHKVAFSPWGAEPKYSKWVVIKRNTATHYPKVPDILHPYTDTPDFLKHIIINASPDDVGSKPNPIEYPWMWRSNFSELSYDYDKVNSDNLIERSLKISYPDSSDVEHIRFIEGDHFGWDEVASWRDGMGFRLYIENINDIDLSYGYFYMGGKDYTSQHYPVIHRWNMTTFSGILNSGWNDINLTFLYADDVSYTEPTIIRGRDPRRLYSINWGTIGFVFRGKGRAFSMNFCEISIRRNHFQHECYPGQRGLYLHANDIMKAPIGEINLQSGAIEFWIRPDWNWDGRDRYYDFKHRTLFHIGNVDNDVFGASISARGLEVYFGNLLSDLNTFVSTGFNFTSIEKVFHIAFVFSNNGTAISSDGSTIRIYIDNNLFSKTNAKWRVGDDRHFNFTFGGQGLLVQKMQGFDATSSAVDGVVCRLRVHNYCKTDYSDSVLDLKDQNNTSLTKPSSLIEISKDNLTFYKVGDMELPFKFEKVLPGDTVSVWTRTNIPKNLTGDEKRTANIIGSWDIGV